MKLLRQSVLFGVMCAVGTVIGCTSGGVRSGGGSGEVLSGAHLKVYEEKVLSNGMHVLLVEDKSLPSFSLQLAVKSGAALDPDGQAGLASLTAHMVERETTSHTVLQFAEALGQIGSRMDASVDDDYTYFSAGTLSKNQEELTQLFSEAILTPRFSDPEIERYRKHVLAALKSRMDEPTSYSDELFRLYAYGPHPYGHLSAGRERDVKALSKRDILKFYLKNYRPNNAILAVVGRMNPNIMEILERTFGIWKAGPVEGAQFTKVAETNAPLIRYVQKPGLVQSQIRMGHVGIKRTDPDYLALKVGMTILGSGFSSRLVDQIRDNQGLTYHIDSTMDGRTDRGLFYVNTFTNNQTVGRTISETMRVVREFVAGGIKKDELDRAKGYLAGRFPQTIETAEKLAFNLLILRIYGIPDTYLSQFQRNIGAVTVDDVNRAVRTHVHVEQMKILVLGDGDTTLDQLRLIAPVEVKKASDF